MRKNFKEILPTDMETIKIMAELMKLRGQVEEPLRIVYFEEVKVKAFSWNDGSGGSAALCYSEEAGDALLIVFDHESNLNAFGGGADIAGTGLSSFEFQKAMYAGLPEHYINLVTNRPETYSFMNIDDPVTGENVLYATGVVYFDGKEWAPSPYYEKMIEIGNDGGIGYFIDAAWLSGDDLLDRIRDHRDRFATKNDPIMEKVAKLGVRL